MLRMIARLAVIIMMFFQLEVQAIDSLALDSLRVDSLHVDSIPVSSAGTDSIEVDSLEESPAYDIQEKDPFAGHVNSFDIKPAKSGRQPAWLFALFALQLLLIGYQRASNPKGLEDIFKAVMNLNIAQQLHREQEQSMPISAIVYIVNFVISGGVFLFLLNRHMGWMQDDTLISMLFFLWAVTVVYSVRFGTLKMVALVFPFRNIAEQYSFNFFLVQKIMGLALIPFNFLIAYSPEVLRGPLIVLAIILVVMLVVWRSLKGLTLARNLISRSAFHFFVYICTLEIAPFCILVKVVVDG